MNARKEIRDYLLASRMKVWLGIARCPIMDTKVPTWRARKNYWALVRKYRELAADLGLSEVSVFSIRDEPAPEPPQELPTDVTDPSPRHQREVGWAVNPAPGVPRMISLADEIL